MHLFRLFVGDGSRPCRCCLIARFYGDDFVILVSDSCSSS